MVEKSQSDTWNRVVIDYFEGIVVINMNIIKVKNKTDMELMEIGRKIGESFASEKSGCAIILPKEHIIKTFQIMTKFYYELGVLYTISKKEEGYLAFWRKNKRIPLKLKLYVIRRMICEVPLRSGLTIAITGSEQFRKIYKNERDYVAVSMLVVLKEFQGKGLMHQLLETPFFIAKENTIPCVLDTDTKLKVKKYIKCGMKVTECKRRGRVVLYTMEYRFR